MVVSDDALLFVAIILINFLLFQIKKDFFKRILGHFMLIIIGLSAYFFILPDKPWGLLISFIAMGVFLMDLFT